MTAAWIVFGLALAVVIYVLFGYPAVLALWRPRRAGVFAAADALPTITVVLPVRNGEPWIRRKLESLLAVDYPRSLLEILLISDGSTDRTVEIAREFPAVQVVSIPPGGKARALNAGLARAAGEMLFFTDVRQQLDPACLKCLVRRFDDPSVGVASGELFIRRGGRSEEQSVGLYWRYEKWIRKRQAAVDSVLGATGCIYMMRRILASPLPADTLNDDMHLPFQAFFAGYRLAFVEEARAYDEPTALDAEFRRKARTLAGVYQVVGRFPALLGPGNRMWIHFASHKLGRLLLPFALLAVAGSSCFLGSPWAPAALAAQAVFYGLALVDRWVPEGNPVKRLTALVRTFVVLMAAALFAASILFRPSDSFWTKPTAGRQAAPQGS